MLVLGNIVFSGLEISNFCSISTFYYQYMDKYYLKYYHISMSGTLATNGQKLGPKTRYSIVSIFKNDHIWVRFVKYFISFLFFLPHDKKSHKISTSTTKEQTVFASTYLLFIYFLECLSFQCLWFLQQASKSI